MDRGLWHCAGGSEQEDHPQEKEMKKGTRPYEQLRKEVKKKGEKERYTHLNAEFQKLARIRKPSSVNNAKKHRKTTEWERLEMS